MNIRKGICRARKDEGTKTVKIINIGERELPLPRSLFFGILVFVCIIRWHSSQAYL